MGNGQRKPGKFIYVETPRWGVYQIYTAHNNRTSNDYTKTLSQNKKETTQKRRPTGTSLQLYSRCIKPGKL